MANSTLDITKVILYDRWPGSPDEKLGIPVDGFTGSSHHNVVSPKYPIGTKIRVYDTTSNGYATFIYLKYIKGTAAVTAVKLPVCMDTSEVATGATTQNYHKVCNDGGEVLLNGPMAISISAMTASYYGWFWCDGVVPVTWVPALTGNLTTDGSLTAGVPFTCADTTAADGFITLKAVAQSSATSTVLPQAAGLCLLADA